MSICSWTRTSAHLVPTSDLAAWAFVLRASDVSSAIAGLHPACRFAASMEERVATASAAVAEMRRRVFERTRLTCSAGIACNPMIAKIASDMNKPNGQHVVLPTRVAVSAFLAELPVRKIPGIGKVAEKTLQCFDIHTCTQLLSRIAQLSVVFTPHRTEWLVRAAMGIDDTRHAAPEPGPGR